MAKKQQSEEELAAELSNLETAIAEKQAKLDELQVEVDTLTSHKKSYQEQIDELKVEKSDLEQSIESLKLQSNILDERLETLRAQRDVLSDEVEQLGLTLENGGKAEKKDLSIAPGVYLKDNHVHIPGYGLREKSKGALSEDELKAFFSAFADSTLTRRQIEKKFLIVVTGEED
jgi:chromosome segregation ATPase